MENTVPTSTTYAPGRGGGRVASPLYRQTLEDCEGFAGLEENADRYDLLLLVKRVGKLAGFSSRMIQLLDYYMAFTRDIDWEEGNRPIVYKSLASTALDLGLSERHIQKLEKQLFEAGAITWRDSGNHKRYGQRAPDTGRLTYAFGVDLTPLAFLRRSLEDKLHKKQLYDQSWRETKRQISWHRRQVRSILLELEREEGASGGDTAKLAAQYDAIAVAIRTHMSLERLRELLEQHKQLHAVAQARVAAAERPDAAAEAGGGDSLLSRRSSSRDEPLGVHKKNTLQRSFDESNTSSRTGDCFQESVTEGPEPIPGNSPAGEASSAGPKGATETEDLILATGIQHITIKQVLLAASSRFQEALPLAPRPINWADVVDAAYRLRAMLHISQQSWGEACGLLGRNGAAICLLLVDQGTQREVNRVRNPAAYFAAMIRKARGGELRLHNSVFGLLDDHS